MWIEQQVAFVISFIVTNCFIQISCNIISNTSSVELIDNIVVIDSNNNHHDKSEKYIEGDKNKRNIIYFTTHFDVINP
jgi:hypothetical protein